MDAGMIVTDDDATIEKMMTTMTAGLTRPSHSINHHNELRKRAAKVRNGMNHEARKPYVEEVKRENGWHSLMHPDHVYAPGAGVKVGGKGKKGRRSMPVFEACRENTFSARFAASTRTS